MLTSTLSRRSITADNFHGAIVRFRERFEGDVITVSDERYDEARAAWNRLHDQRPAVIAVAASDRDVTTAVRFARANGLKVAVQATGHGPGTPANGALLIVTSQLTSVTIDAEAQTARVSAGAKWGAVLAPAQEHGLAPLLGSTTDVGAVGYTLGGGMGWLARKYGLASDSVVSFEVVTPDGATVRASRAEQSELFWALRGAGAGSLGVVTAMTIKLYPVTTVYAGNLFYPAEMARDVLARWREWVDDAPHELTSSAGIISFPDLDVVPEPMRGQTFAYVRGCWSGDLTEGEVELNGWRNWRSPAIDLFGPMPFSASDMISNDPVDPMPARSTTEWLSQLVDGAIEAIVEAAAPSSGERTELLGIEIRHAGGAVRDKGVNAVNYVGRRDEFLVMALGLVMSPEGGEHLDTELDALRAGLAPFVTGATYLNFVDGAERRGRTRSSLSEGSAARFAGLKRAVDGDNRFSHGVDVA